jgi:hypothetical protein
MRYLHNEKGIALVTSLMFTVLSLVITMTLLYMVTAGIRSSGSMKRYRTANEAAYGGLEMMLKDIMSKGLVDASLTSLTDATFKSGMQTYLAGFNTPSISDCLRTKLVNFNRNWSTACKNYTLDASKSFDVKFNLNSASGTPYVIYSKIVDTMEHKLTVFENKSTSSGLVMSKKTVSMAGNSDPSSLSLEGFATSDLEGGSGDKNPHVPYTYRIEVKSERAQNALEKAAISVLYVY